MVAIFPVGVEGWNVTSAGWQVTLCDPIWHVSSSSGEACCELLYPVTSLTTTYFAGDLCVKSKPDCISLFFQIRFRAIDQAGYPSAFGRI